MTEPSLNCREFLSCCGFLEFPLCVGVLQVQSQVFGRGPEYLCHLPLVQPYGRPVRLDIHLKFPGFVLEYDNSASRGASVDITSHRLECGLLEEIRNQPEELVLETVSPFNSFENNSMR